MPTEIGFLDPGQIALLIPVIALCIPIVRNLTSHHEKLVQMRLQSGNQSDSPLAAQLQSLQKEVSDLRDTSTRYDMSFDAALQRIESRVGTLEHRMSAVEQASALQTSK